MMKTLKDNIMVLSVGACVRHGCILKKIKMRHEHDVDNIYCTYYTVKILE